MPETEKGEYKSDEKRMVLKVVTKLKGTIIFSKKIRIVFLKQRFMAFHNLHFLFIKLIQQLFIKIPFNLFGMAEGNMSSSKRTNQDRYAFWNIWGFLFEI